MKCLSCAVHLIVFTLKLHNVVSVFSSLDEPPFIRSAPFLFFIPPPRGDGVQIKVTPLLVFKPAKLTGRQAFTPASTPPSCCFHTL